MKKIGYAILSVALFMFAFHSASATEYKYEGWTSSGGYGSATKVDDNITNLKGEDTASGGMYLGPFSKASTAKLEDGILEEVYVELDPAKFSDHELFEVSLALKNDSNAYVNEAVVMTQKVGDEFNITAGWAPNFKGVVKTKGIYTYQWKMYMEEDKTYVEFTLLKGNREIATSGKVDFDSFGSNDAKNPISGEDNVSVKYLWFCNIAVANGVNVYTELPTVEVTFVDPTEDEDLVLEVYKYAAFTEEEIEEFENELKEAAKKEGYTFDGFYSDKEFKNKFDMSQEFLVDTTIYLKATKIVEPSKNVVPPKTGDINLFLVIGAFVLGGAGLIITRKKLIKNS